MENVAVTFFAADIVNVQVEFVPEQSPLQPAKVKPWSAVAVRVMVVPTVYVFVADTGHISVPSDTVPEPVPDFV
nr:hypothetical protein [Candidatus Magnetobacterium casensis]